MKKIFLFTFLLSFFVSFSQDNLLVQAPACSITGVFNGEKAKWETENVKIGINKSTADFVSVINFDEFHIQNKITGEELNFEEKIMRIHGQLPLSDMLANTKTHQSYKAEFTVEFGDESTQAVFIIDITYVSKHYKAVRVYSNIAFSNFNKTAPEGFEDDLLLEMRFQLYKFEGYY